MKYTLKSVLLVLPILAFLTEIESVQPANAQMPLDFTPPFTADGDTDFRELLRRFQTGDPDCDRILQNYGTELEACKARYGGGSDWPAHSDCIDRALQRAQSQITSVCGGNLAAQSLAKKTAQPPAKKEEPVLTSDELALMEKIKARWQGKVDDKNVKRDKPTCSDWPHYRDGEFFKEWDSETQKYLISQEALTAIKELKQEVLSDTAWARSDSGLLVGTIAAVMRVKTDLILDLLSFHPAAHLLKAGDKAVFCTYDGVQDAVSSVSFRSLGSSLVKACSKEVVKAKFGKVAETAFGIQKLAENVARAVNQPTDHAELRRSVSEAVLRLDREMARYQNAVLAGSEKLETLNRFKAEMDKACSGPAREKNLSNKTAIDPKP